MPEVPKKEPAPVVLRWSADDAAGESVVRNDLARWLDSRERDSIDDAEPAGWTRDHRSGPVRGALVAGTAGEAARRLRGLPPSRSRRPRPVVLMFPGQGAQYRTMAHGLYQWQRDFTAELDNVFDGLGSLGAEVRADWLESGSDVPLDDVRRAQPLLFGIDYALGAMLLSAGLRPSGLLGHSVGEVVAATIAGVFDVRAATEVMADRIRHIADTPPGGMLAVASSEADLRPYLRDGVVVGAVNSPRQTILAGPGRSLAEIAGELRGRGTICRSVAARQAFHSPLMATACARSVPLLRSLPLRAPSIPLCSAYLAGRLTADRATDPMFWATQPAEPVLFGPALDEVLCRDVLLVEAGPGQGLSTLARGHRAVSSGRSAVVSVLPPGTADPAAERRSVLDAVARIWAEGHDIDLDRFALGPAG